MPKIKTTPNYKKATAKITSRTSIQSKDKKSRSKSKSVIVFAPALAFAYFLDICGSWDLTDTGFNRYYNSNESRRPDTRMAALNEMFNSLRNSAEAQEHEKDARSAAESARATKSDGLKRQDMDDEDLVIEELGTDMIGPASIEKYTETLGINALNYEFFVLCEIVQIDELFQLTRKGFTEGWMSQWDKRGSPLEANIEAHRRYIRSRIEELPKDGALFKKVYRQVFLAGKEPEVKTLPKKIAMAYWEELFTPTVHPWKTKNVNFLEAWLVYMEEKWTRNVSKDMWNQTLEFANKTVMDDTLGFWSEDQAWPGVIDDFVLWCRETGVVVTARPNVGMQVDD
ncbi:Cullin binding-domain-containing protein [Lasiosphaeris hirsuta]|uniref:Defective in cullin neddylation protein n=1 Tax=Lasiosphaeris hirsuta TaxID=260670 RepID=A0AA39ZV86_9PEZI|nr:Cullin binding-domain-containing protein [Lasiosphaeris hirsuta]